MPAILHQLHMLGLQDAGEVSRPPIGDPARSTLIVGPAGSGKTYLARQMLKEITTRDPDLDVRDIDFWTNGFWTNGDNFLRRLLRDMRVRDQEMWDEARVTCREPRILAVLDNIDDRCDEADLCRLAIHAERLNVTYIALAQRAEALPTAMLTGPRRKIYLPEQGRYYYYW